MNNELPFQTWERITGENWPGGCSACVRAILRIFWITEIPGTAEANLALQRKILEQAAP